MIRIHAKVGTGPHTVIDVKYKRKNPKVGDSIQFKDISASHDTKWRGGLVYGITDIGLDVSMYRCI